MNETYFINLRGKVNIPQKLEIGKNYSITADCSVTQSKVDDNHDGTVNITFKAEPMTLDITGENGEVIKAKDPRKNSVKFRNYLFKLYAQEGYTEDFDTVYDMVILEALSVMPTLLQGAIKRLNEKV